MSLTKLCNYMLLKFVFSMLKKVVQGDYMAIFQKVIAILQKNESAVLCFLVIYFTRWGPQQSFANKSEGSVTIFLQAIGKELVLVWCGLLVNFCIYSCNILLNCGHKHSQTH